MLHCHHHSGFCIKMGSHFNVPLMGGGGRCVGGLVLGGGEQSQKDSVHNPQLLKTKESRSGIEPKPIYFTSITPYR